MIGFDQFQQQTPHRLGVFRQWYMEGRRIALNARPVPLKRKQPASSWSQAPPGPMSFFRRASAAKGDSSGSSFGSAGASNSTPGFFG